MRFVIPLLLLLSACASVPMPKTACVENAASYDAAVACIHALKDGGVQ
jgi:hypothetical protein